MEEIEFIEAERNVSDLINEYQMYETAGIDESENILQVPFLHSPLLS